MALSSLKLHAPVHTVKESKEREQATILARMKELNNAPSLEPLLCEDNEEESDSGGSHHLIKEAPQYVSSPSQHQASLSWIITIANIVLFILSLTILALVKRELSGEQLSLCTKESSFYCMVPPHTKWHTRPNLLLQKHRLLMRYNTKRFGLLAFMSTTRYGEGHLVI